MGHGGSEIGQCRLPFDRHRHLTTTFDARCVVVELDPALDAIEQGGSDRPVSERGVPIDHRPDVRIDAEDLLDDHDRGRSATRVHLIGIEHVPVIGGELDHHAPLPFGSRSRSSAHSLQSMTPSMCRGISTQVRPGCRPSGFRSSTVSKNASPSVASKRNHVPDRTVPPVKM